MIFHVLRFHAFEANVNRMEEIESDGIHMKT